jgi:VIT1/CCC1 family predicted Fe2+/Mn2+ transporter
MALTPGDLLEETVNAVGSKDEAMLKVMMAFEFGQNENDQRNPWKAMFFAGVLFILASLPTWLPFCFTNNVTNALIASICLSSATMFFIGAIKTVSTRGSWLCGGAENFICGAMGGGIAFGVGWVYDYFT